MCYFILGFGIVIFFIVDFLGEKKFQFYATIAFVVGSLTSMLCGYIGMKIAVCANYRTTYKAMTSLPEAFKLAYRAGCVMGFSSVGIGLGVLLTLLLVYVKIFNPVVNTDTNNFGELMELFECIVEVY